MSHRAAWDPVFALIERDHAAYEAANEPGISDEEMSRRLDTCTEGWWRLVETPPTTIDGAIAVASYVAGLADGQSRPTRREPNWTDENGAALALRSVAKYLQSVSKGAPEV